MNTYDEIRTAAVNLPPWERTLLASELFAADESEPDPAELEAALERGLADVRTGAVQPLTVELLRQRAAKGRRDDLVTFLNASPDVPPLAGDELHE